MAKNRTIDQHIAIFGESGSGKTILVSSFYGKAQEPNSSTNYSILADKVGQGNKLHQNYLGMRDESNVPVQTIFDASAYEFSVKIKNNGAAEKGRPFDVLRLTWHDYPGEWFEEDLSSEKEEARRVETFRSLLKSDVAFFLVDGQRLLDYAGEEERYLKSVFTNFSNGLLALQDDILGDEKELSQFPRIWVIALSKADLLPDMDVIAFRDMVIGKAGGEVARLNEVVSSFLQHKEALSAGQDFMLLSSAKFEAGNIEVNERVGVDLMLPMAAILPLERHTRWANRKVLPARIAENFLNADAVHYALIAAGLLAKGMKFGKVAKVQAALQLVLQGKNVDDAINLVGEKLRGANARAVEDKQHLAAMLTGFKIKLEEAEKSGVFLRSQQ